MEKENIRIALTGHRPNRLYANVDQEVLVETIEAIVKSLMHTYEIEYLYCGGASGYDQLAAEIIMKMSPDTKLLMVWPYRGMHLHPAQEKLFAAAFKNIYTSHDKDDEDECYKIRDHWMVDACDLVFAAWDKQPGGGTYDTIQYAKKKDRETLIIYVDRMLEDDDD